MPRRRSNAAPGTSKAQTGEETSKAPAQELLPVVANRRGYSNLHGRNNEERILTTAEAKVLEVLTNPDNADKNAKALLEATGLGQSKYYAVRRDPWFIEQFKKTQVELVMNSVQPIITQAVKVATKEQRDGHNDRKMLLNMAGFDTDRRSVDHNVAGQVIVGVVGVEIDTV